MTDPRLALSDPMLKFILEEAQAGLPVSLHVQVDAGLSLAELAAALILVASTPGVTKVGAVSLVASDRQRRLGVLQQAVKSAGTS